jgi:hypothetical protein
MVPGRQASKLIENMDLDKSGALEFAEVGPVVRREFGLMRYSTTSSIKP